MQYTFMNKIKKRFFPNASLKRCHPSLASNVPHSKHCSQRLTWTFSFIYTSWAITSPSSKFLLFDNPKNISSKSNYCNYALSGQKVLQ